MWMWILTGWVGASFPLAMAFGLVLRHYGHSDPVCGRTASVTKVW